jgi:excinuclease UvrABC ATPase subunit
MSMATRTDTRWPVLHASDNHDLIRVHGARVNNPKDISVEIPKRRLTTVTGVSGSGKSSLVFGTIAAESQRLINETYSAFVQRFMPTLARPEVDVLEGLTTAIIVDQERMGAGAGGDPRSTIGTATDSGAMLRILFSRLGKPHIGSPNAYSFNVPSVRASGAITVERGARKTVRATFSRTGGMCPRCEGRGSVNDIDLSQLYDDTKSLGEGALTIPGYSMDGWYGPEALADTVRRVLSSVSTRPFGQPSSTVSDSFDGIPEPRGRRTHVGRRIRRHVLVRPIGLYGRDDCGLR